MQPKSLEQLPNKITRPLVHEWQFHQIELETQNEELRIALGQLGESLAKYSDLYDFAPVAGTSIEVIGSTADELVTATSGWSAKKLWLKPACSITRIISFC